MIAIVSTIAALVVLVVGFAVMNSRFQVNAAFVCERYNFQANKCDQNADVLEEGNILVFDVRNFRCQDDAVQVTQKFMLIDGDGEESLNWEIGYNNTCEEKNYVGKYGLTEEDLADLQGDEVTVRYTAVDVKSGKEIMIEKEYELVR